ncbi:unnamed protein product [Lota lota]
MKYGNPGSLGYAVQHDHTSVPQATTRKSSTMRPLEAVMSEDERLGSEPLAKRTKAIVVLHSLIWIDG